MGRRAHYAPRIADQICEHIALGSTLQEALEKVGYLAPSLKQCWAWLDAHEDFREKYDRARQLQADTDADHMRVLTREVITKPGAAAAYRVAIEALKWQAEVRNRTKYGKTDNDSGKKTPMDPTKIRSEIKRLEAELGVVESAKDGKKPPLKAVK